LDCFAFHVACFAQQRLKKKENPIE